MSSFHTPIPTLGFFPAFLQDLFWNHFPKDNDCHRNNYEFIKVANNWDEIGDEVDGTEDIAYD